MKRIMAGENMYGTLFNYSDASSICRPSRLPFTPNKSLTHMETSHVEAWLTRGGREHLEDLGWGPGYKEGDWKNAVTGSVKYAMRQQSLADTTEALALACSEGKMYSMIGAGVGTQLKYGSPIVVIDGLGQVSGTPGHAR